MPRPAFTLIELIAVITLLALLATTITWSTAEQRVAAVTLENAR